MKVVSGGQTGADRAALDAAKAAGLPTGGYAPSHYGTERGPDPSLKTFGLVAGGSLAWRTERNVVTAGATIVFAVRPSPGSDMTVAMAARHRKPCLVVNPWAPEVEKEVLHFLNMYRPAVLNIAGHRESKAPGIYARVYGVLMSLLSPPVSPASGPEPVNLFGPQRKRQRAPE